MRFSTAIEGYELSSLADGYSPLTLAAYKSSLGLLIDFLGDPEVGQVTEGDLQRFFAHLRSTYKSDRTRGELLSTASLHRYWKSIRSFFIWADKQFSTGRPDIGFRMPRYTNAEIVPYTEDEVKRLLKAAENSVFVHPKKGQKKDYRMRTPEAPRNRAILLVLLDTGIRPGELCRLRIADANLSNGEIQVHPHHAGKTKPRTVIVEKGARNAVWEYLSKRQPYKPFDPLFITQDGQEMTRYTIGSLIADMGRRAGVPNANPYRCRHTFAIEYLRNGGDIFTLQRLLGHSNLNTTRIYLQLAQTDVQAAHRRASPVEKWRL